MGEPYVTSERGRRMRGSEMPGLGLGFFIAKTLLARGGAKISLENKQFPQRGAIVKVRWKRPDFERARTWQKQIDSQVDPPGGAVAEPAAAAQKVPVPPLAENPLTAYLL